MCGIIAAFDKKAQVNEDVLLQFEDQSSRGTNGFGALFINEDGTFDIKRATGQIKAIIDVKLQPTKMLLFHHRQPSSSKNKISQTHPIKISAGDLKHDYYFAHNGIVYNDKERKKVHNEELGYQYSTEKEEPGWYEKKEYMYNDSETLGYDVARFIEGQTDKIETIGSAAFIMVQVDKKTQKVTQIYYSRNSANPLKLAKTRDYIFLSSEGKGEDVKPDMLYSFGLNDFKIKKKAMVISSTRPVEPKEIGFKTTAGKVKTTFDGYKYNDDDDDFGSYNGYNTHAYSGRVISDSPGADEWMTWDQEKEFEEHLDSARGAIDEVEEIVKGAINGEELYLIDTAEIVKGIAVDLARAIEYARSQRIQGYLDAETDTPPAEEPAKVEPAKTDVKVESIAKYSSK